MLKPVSGEMEELQEILTRLSAVTPGCEVRSNSFIRTFFSIVDEDWCLSLLSLHSFEFTCKSMIP